MDNDIINYRIRGHNESEAEKKLIETEMSQGVLNNEELLSSSQRHGEIMKILDERELRWLELSEK